MLIHNIIFKLGSLEVFTKRDITLGISAQGLPGIYWMDKHQVHGCGPFSSIYQAMEHYTIVVKQRREMTPIVALPPPTIVQSSRPSGDLIQVDFVNKRRTS